MKRLYRNPDDQMIGGVCSGIAEFVNVDPTAVRLAFLLLLCPTHPVDNHI